MYRKIIIFIDFFHINLFERQYLRTLASYKTHSCDSFEIGSSVKYVLFFAVVQDDMSNNSVGEKKNINIYGRFEKIG